MNKKLFSSFFSSFSSFFWYYAWILFAITFYVINEPVNRRNVENLLLIDMCVSMSQHRFDSTKNGSSNYWYLEWTNKNCFILWQPLIWNVNDLATLLRSMTKRNRLKFVAQIGVSFDVSFSEVPTKLMIVTKNLFFLLVVAI